jgi:prefoldin subunit 5
MSNYFFQIPKEGDADSHRFILEKEAEYLGINLNTDDVQALLAEITALRQEIITAQQTIQTLTSGSNGQ